MNGNINFFFLLSFFVISCNSFAAQSNLFPVSTQINRANLYDYSINVRLSKEYIALQYDDEAKSFYDGVFLSYVTTTIPTSSGDLFEYSYNISDFSSSCETNGNGTVIINDFVDLYIDHVHYPDVNNISNFSFDTENITGFERATNQFSLVTNQEIPSDEPLSCNGRITFNVELQL